MPKKSRRGKGKRKHRQLGVIHQADVTVNDFANCKPEHAKSGRITKATANSLIKEVKKISGPVCEMNSAILYEGDTAWYDKNLSDFEDDEDNGTLDENHNHTVLSLPNQGTQRQKKTTSIIGTSDNIIKGCEYPIDVWFLVSNYIRPEDVGRFASICKASYYVTSTTQFWSRLYHRFCATHDELPVSLKPNAMQKIFKLRACVIRSLFFTYPPYRSRTRSTVPLDSETPHSLEHSKCLYMWVSHKHQTNKTWNFSFKFQMPSLKNQKFSDLGVNYDHLWANSEENCCILSVVCSHFIRVPAIMGMILTKVYLNVSRDMRFFNLKLVFHTLREKGSYSKNNGVTVTLDPVINAKVLHWWHPHYAGNE